MRTLEEIIDQAIKNTLFRFRTQEPKRIPVKVTGNKKALHQKSKNKTKSWRI